MKPINFYTLLKNYSKSVPLASFSHRQINKFLNKTNRKSQIATFHTGRCGSTVLGQMLNAHSQVYWASEIFEEYMHSQASADGKEFTTHVIERSRQAKVSKLYGFETKYLPQQHISNKTCINLQLSCYVDLLNDIGFAKYIIIHRKNYLRRAISAQIGMESRQWHSKYSAAQPTKVRLNIDSFTTGAKKEPLLELFERLDENYAKLAKLLSCKDTLILTYEDDIMENPLNAYTKVCNFLNIAIESPQIDLRRTNPFNCQDVLTNFRDIESLLLNTKYEWMVEG